ncbi:SMI1/KNR4 family protein [Iodobacter fluviatilis]|uniref:Knr4/Smi1-like domain-containing protein n=1 Tax=Iodobacter fluviatilis TaxID=537 RepID=A0A377Q457_9NEIS|nr:SMI1/KNR4 family protein [Iodobacter fluviatilis]TCU90521.1 hypothetical protein EV682_101555 [Iodobacter fluviatilis]STQ89548.1 Uncharacterised protein [Iodobacter fluviatilis]
MFDKISLINDAAKLFLSSESEVDEAEVKLGICFPSGYREYVTRFGEGILGGTYVRIYPPHRILSGINNNEEWRQRIMQYWFWDNGRDTLSKETALESIIIGDTYDGDELIVHASHPERIHVLPRYSEDIHIAGNGLAEAMEWLCSSGVLTEAFDDRIFEPFDSRAQRS